MSFQPLIVDGFDVEEHVLEAQALPMPKNFLVAQEEVSARFEIILLSNVAAFDLACQRESVHRLNEGDVINDEHTRFANRS